MSGRVRSVCSICGFQASGVNIEQVMDAITEHRMALHPAEEAADAEWIRQYCEKQNKAERQ